MGYEQFAKIRYIPPEEKKKKNKKERKIEEKKSLTHT
jgi:hypothetical protein